MARYQPEAATAQRDAARRHTHRAYAERNELLGLLARLWPAHFMPVTRNLEPLDRRITLCIHAPGGIRLAYVLDEEEAAAADFEGLITLKESHWDKCRRAQRTDRLRKLPLNSSVSPL